MNKLVFLIHFFREQIVILGNLSQIKLGRRVSSVIQLSFVFYFFLLSNFFFRDLRKWQLKIYKNFLTRLNFDGSNLNESTVIMGWTNPHFEIIVVDREHNQIDCSSMGALMRLDVAKQMGDSYRKSGFKVWVEESHQYIGIHIIFRNKFKEMYYKPQITSNVISLYGPHGDCEPCKQLENFGFVDNLKVNLAGGNIEGVFINLMLTLPRQFKDFRIPNYTEVLSTYINDLILRKYDLLQQCTPLINSDLLDDQNIPKDSETFKPIILSYELENLSSTKLEIVSETQLVKTKFLVSGKVLLNKLNGFHNSSLMSGEENNLLRDRDSKKITGLIVPNSPANSRIEHGIVLPGLNNLNYFHFLFEACPGLWLNRHQIGLDMPIVLHSGTHQNIVEILGILGFTNLIFVKENDVVSIGTTYTFGKSALFFDALERDINDLRVKEELLFEFINFVKKEVLFNEMEKNQSSKIFLLRDSGVRNLLNGKNLLKIAVEKGFDGINPYELSFTQQVNLIYHAKQIILTGGASMANLMFAKPGTNILYLTHSNLKFYKLPQFIGALSKTQVKTLYGKSKILSLSDVWSPYDFFHGDYVISPSKFVGHLTTMQ